MKHKIFCMTKDTFMWTKHHPTEKEKIFFTNYMSNKEQIYKIYKKHQNYMSRKQITK